MVGKYDLRKDPFRGTKCLLKRKTQAWHEHINTKMCFRTLQKAVTENDARAWWMDKMYQDSEFPHNYRYNTTQFNLLSLTRLQSNTSLRFLDSNTEFISRQNEHFISRMWIQASYSYIFRCAHHSAVEGALRVVKLFTLISIEQRVFHYVIDGARVRIVGHPWYCKCFWCGLVDG